MGFYSCVFRHAALILLVLLNTSIGAEFENDLEIAMESRTNCGGNPNRTIKLDGCNNNCIVTSDTFYPLQIQAGLTLTKNYTGLAYNITARRSSSREEQTIYRNVKPGPFNGSMSIQEVFHVSFSSDQFRNKSGEWTFQVTITPNTSSEIILCESFPIQMKFSNKTYNDSCTPVTNITDECAPLSCRPTSGSTVKYSCQCDHGSAIWEGNKQSGSCKKIPGTLCSPYVPYNECITNAECKPLNVTELYSCDCKIGYNTTPNNNRACISEERGDGGGASTLVVSVLGLHILTIFSIVSSIFKPMSLAL